MTVNPIYGDPHMKNIANMFTAYMLDYNWDRMELYRKRGKLAGDMFIEKVSIPKKGRPVRGNWKANRHLFWINDYIPKSDTSDFYSFGYNRDGPIKFREEIFVKKCLNTIEKKMVMPPGLNEPLLWDVVRLPPVRANRPGVPKIARRKKIKETSDIKNMKDRFFLECKPTGHSHFDIHPEFPSENDLDRMRTKYWEDGTIFSEPKKRENPSLKNRKLVDMPI